MKKILFKKNIFGIASSLFYGIVPLLVLIEFPILTRSNFGESFLNGGIVTFMKDVWGLPINFILIFLLKKQSNFWKITFSKTSLFIAIASIFGGPIGYTLINTSFFLAGPSFGHIFTSLEPVILLIAVFLFYKRKFNWQIIFGIFISTMAVISLVFGSIFTIKKHVLSILLGSFLAILGTACWSIESLFFEKALKTNPLADVNTLIFLKMLVALFFNFAIMLPIISASLGSVHFLFNKFNFLFSKQIIWRFILAGLMLFLGRLFFFMSIEKIGPTISNILYQISIILTPIFSMIFFLMTNTYIGNDKNFANFKYQINFWITTIAILVGVSIVIYGEYLLLKNKKINI